MANNNHNNHKTNGTVFLDQLAPGQQGRITQIDGDPALTVRLMEMGVLTGERVEFVGKAPLGDPIAVMIRGSRLALRRRDAASVSVELSSAT